jgi:hypothetical protein
MSAYGPPPSRRDVIATSGILSHVEHAHLSKSLLRHREETCFDIYLRQ